jgi:hypothetical protein
MRACFTLAAASLALLAGGCGGGSSSKRPSVAGYIEQINAIESQLAGPLDAVSTAGHEFAAISSGHGSQKKTAASLAAEGRSLQHALVRIRALRGQLAAVDPPPPAAHLRALLLALTDAEAARTNELAQLIAFVPRFGAALIALSPASARLRTALSKTTPLGTSTAGVDAALDAKAQALRRYQGALSSVLRALAPLHPPPVSAPQYRAQIRALTRLRATAGRLASALAAHQANVSSLLNAFDAAAHSDHTIAAQRAQIAAIRAYDARAARLNTQARAVELERARLAQALP